jgi:hypothetical protein
MSVDVMNQLERYYAQVDAADSPIDPSEVFDRVDAVSPLPRIGTSRQPGVAWRRSRQNFAVAAAAAAVVLFVVGGVVWLSPLRNGSEAPATEPTEISDSVEQATGSARYVLSAPEFETAPNTDYAGAVPGDHEATPQPLGAVTELPGVDYLNFLFGSCRGCDRDAAFMDPDRPRFGTGIGTAGRPFHVRHGFISESETPLGKGFSVVLYITLYDEVDEPASGSFVVGETYKFTPDYVLRGLAGQCGPTYNSQTGPVTCEWFVHDFPQGLPFGRYEVVAVWEAPCSAWIDMGLTTTCEDPSEVLSMFSSEADSGWYEELPIYGIVNGATAELPSEANQDVAGVGTVTDILALRRCCDDPVVLDGAIWVGHEGLTRIDIASRTWENAAPGLNPTGAVEAAGALWVTTTSGTVVRFDPNSRQVTDTIEVNDGRWMSSPAVAGGGLWVVSAGPDALVRIDLAERRVTDRYRLPIQDAFWWIVATEDAIYGSDALGHGDMHRFDLTTREFTHVIPADVHHIENPFAIVAGGGLWIGGERIVRIDLQSQEITHDITTIDGSKPLFAEGAVWISDRTEGTVLRIDPVTAQIVASIDVGLQPWTPIVAAGSIWVPNLGDRTVTRVDPVTNEVIGTITIGGVISELLATEGAVWVFGDSVTRIEIK